MKHIPSRDIFMGMIEISLMGSLRNICTSKLVGGTSYNIFCKCVLMEALVKG